MTPEDFEELCKIVYKDYGKDRTYMQRENTVKYTKKIRRVIEYLEEKGYISEV